MYKAKLTAPHPALSPVVQVPPGPAGHPTPAGNVTGPGRCDPAGLPGHAAGSPSSLVRLHQITNSIDINGLPTGVAGHPVPQPAVAPPVQSKGHSSSSTPRQSKSKSRSTAAAAAPPTPAQTAGYPALLGAGYHYSGVVPVQLPHHAVPPIPSQARAVVQPQIAPLHAHGPSGQPPGALLAIHSAIRHHVPISRPESSSHPYYFLLNTVAHVGTSMTLPPLPPRRALNSPFTSGSSRHMTATIEARTGSSPSSASTVLTPTTAPWWS